MIAALSQGLAQQATDQAEIRGIVRAVRKTLDSQTVDGCSVRESTRQSCPLELQPLLELDGFACGCENLFGELFIIHDARKDYGSHHG